MYLGVLFVCMCVCVKSIQGLWGSKMNKTKILNQYVSTPLRVTTQKKLYTLTFEWMAV